MFFKKASSDKARDFWNWFTRNNSKYLFLSEVDEEEKNKLMQELLSHLHEYCEHLYFEVGGHSKDDKVDLVITAEGIVKHFDKVEELVDAAPELSSWRFLKFRQPHGPGIRAEFAGRIFDPEEIIFISLYSEEDPDGIGIQVCYPDFNEEERNIFINGTYILLDSLIGERSVALDIEHLDVIKTPEDISEDDYPRLSHLAQTIKERKIFKYPGENYDVIEHIDADGYLTFITANLAYRDFRFKQEFPWFLKITMNVKVYNENGHPLPEEAEVLNSFEEFLDKKIKEGTVAHYIGRTTLYKKREILYFLAEPEKVKSILQHILADDDAIRNFQFHIEQDSEWNNAKGILRKG